ncbi:tetratricopeptide repeat protein [Propionivibrio sp.]|uniref:tetratricopeptide repeat protein n=1 Tax=Propionivibrio sp. TaxID=2212460 RepID=UPI00263A399E|nr:tetratricopeptide repeat protein [Propionivibrio sp.]
MSLLMEALKKAEEAKRASGENHTPELTLRPLTAPIPASPLPELALHIDSVDADLSAVVSDAPARRRAPASPSRPSNTDLREAAERSAVRNVFSAKEPPRSRHGLWLVLALSGLAVVGLGAYFWWQLQAVSSTSLARPLPAAQAPATPAVIARPTPTVVLTPEILLPPQPSVTRPAAESPALFTPRAQSSPRNTPAASQGAPDGPLRLSRSESRNSQTVERAYDALQSGRLDEAQRNYEQALRNDGKNTDALLGLASIAARQGQAELAQGYYQRALESDPNDATAQAGLINSRGQADPGLSESHLKSALAGQPDSAALHFALGNLYGRQARWSEAQQAYFRAYSGEPNNADFIFNLAVSLDHLHQNKLAAQYYQMALNAARVENTSFDKAQVKTRILELQP